MTGKTRSIGSNIERGQSVRKTFLALREMIVFGRLAPGSWIIEGDLAEKLGVSRTPLRSALQWLEHEGYVLTVGSGPKTKLTVAPLTQKDAREVYLIVGQMEGLAGRMAASLPLELRKPLIATLKQLNDQMMRATDSPDSLPNTFFDLDTKFHASIVDAGAGTRFLSIYNGIKPHTERYWWLYSSSSPNELKLSFEEHKPIIEAVAEGDADAAERALQANWERGAERLVKVIARFGERGSID
ncbi:MAG TPA: GntR family transcriptional regulator [Acidisarcina sp.]|nr:GntR family transcriptional regulator [Acidisarcina sp.]